jgi:hypothetical protein
MAGSERKREIRRRRTRRQKLVKLRLRAAKGGPNDKVEVARKLRRLTPGADVIIADLGI